jgi:hypothetical protein
VSETLIAIPLADVASEALVAELKRRGGFRIQVDDGKGWMTPWKASEDIGRHGSYIAGLLRRGINPPGLEVDRGPKGRLRQVRLSPEFRAWAAARLEPQPSLL